MEPYRTTVYTFHHYFEKIFDMLVLLQHVFVFLIDYLCATFTFSLVFPFPFSVTLWSGC
jgi:hypothetical protein